MLIGKLAEQIEQEEGVKLQYCGEFHFSKETGHVTTKDHAILADIELDEETNAKAIELVNLVFAWFTEWTEELLTYAQQNLNYQNLNYSVVPPMNSAETEPNNAVNLALSTK